MMTWRPKLGQHFLLAAPLLERICEAALIPGESVIEIGPGRGALTKYLLARAGQVIAIEIDHQLAQNLPEECGNPEHLEVIQGNILKQDLQVLAQHSNNDSCVIVGNLPYYITSPILRAVFQTQFVFRVATFVVQEEVADRILAGPGNRSYGFLSCICQLYSQPRKLFRIPASAFVPPPKVHSAVVQFQLSGTRPPEKFLKFISACFKFPRKTLRNNLSGNYDAAKVSDDPFAQKRAQQLTIEELLAMWIRISGIR